MRRVIAVLVVLAAAAALPTAEGSAKPRPKPRPKVVLILAASPSGGLVGGDSVTVVARAKPLPKGYRMLIEYHETGTTVWTSLSECASAGCSGDWTEAEEATVAFRARVIHRKAITKGAITGVLATKTIGVHWAAPPPPPPPPPLMPLGGKYCGFNDQGRTVCLDVGADRLTVTSFSTQSLVTCTDDSRWYWLLSFGGRTVPIGNLAFSFSYSGQLNSSSTTLTNIQTTYTLSGTFDTAGNAQGTIALSKISWDSGGTHYDCSSAPYGWHARLGA